MDSFLSIASQFITEVGSLLLVPLILFVLGMIVGMKFKTAFRAGLVTGVALVGIYTVLGMFMNTLQPVATGIAGRFESGMRLTFMDVGWPACFAAGVALPVVISYVLIGALVNLVLVIIGWIKTLQIGMVEPIMGEGLVGYIVFAITGNWFYGLIASLLIKVLMLVLADWQAPMVEEFFGFKGVALIQSGVNEWGLLAWPLAKLMDKIPFLNKRRFTADWVASKLGVFGEPMFLGVIFGIMLGILAGYTWTQVIVLAIYLAAAMYILPRMIGILMEGFIPVMRGVGDWLQSHAKGRQIYIGMDPALGTGHPAILATVMIMIPITVGIAVILPGNKVLPMGDLVTLVFTFMFLVVMNKGDILRSLITCIIAVPILLWIATLGAPYIHQILLDAKLVEPGVNSMCLFEGGQPWYWPFAQLATLISGGG